ncbi:hypothetical protein BC835DRAFT_678801 [Cytidiella melzeri]|nr:hypothetical protein BC835DRAFT_678801 [Cytidiella melzeri]
MIRCLICASKIQLLTPFNSLPTIQRNRSSHFSVPSRFPTAPSSPAMRPSLPVSLFGNGRSGSKATVITLAVLLAVTSVSLLITLVILCGNRRRCSHHDMSHVPGPPSQDQGLSYDIRSRHPQDLEEAAGAQLVFTESRSSNLSVTSSNEAILPSVPSRVRSMLPSRHAVAPPILVVHDTTPHTSFEHTSPTRNGTHTHTASAAAHFLRRLLTRSSSRFRQWRAAVTTLPLQDDTQNIRTARHSATLSIGDYPSSTAATVDSVNSARFSYTGMSPSQPSPSFYSYDI